MCALVTGVQTCALPICYTVLLGASEPGDDAPIEWLIDWGDGTAPTRVAGDAAEASHSFAAAGDFTIRATLVNDDGRFTAGPLTVAVAASPPPPSLLVTQAAIDDGVLAVRFSAALGEAARSEEHTSELQSLMRRSYAVFCLQKQIQ